MSTAVLSLDYDSCFDVLFLDITNATDEKMQKVKEAMDIARGVLQKIIRRIKAQGYDKIIVYVGSNRQCALYDNSFGKEHGNGSCFENFARLCEQTGWEFETLLLADLQNKQPAGTAMYDERYECQINGYSKLEIIQMQMDDIKKNHPEGNVDFYFFDDDTYDAIIPEIANHYRNNLPAEINMLKLTRYDWYETVNHRRPSLMEETVITQPKIEAKEIKSNAEPVNSVKSTVKKINSSLITVTPEDNKENASSRMIGKNISVSVRGSLGHFSQSNNANKRKIENETETGMKLRKI